MMCACYVVGSQEEHGRIYYTPSEKAKRTADPLIIPSVAVVEEVSQSSIETIEAYTGHHIGLRESQWKLS